VRAHHGDGRRRHVERRLRGGPPKQPGWQAALANGAFPLKVQKGDKVMLEVTRVDKKTLDAALFAPPEGFQKLDMRGMMRKRP
jgi:hypothetical protein